MKRQEILLVIDRFTPNTIPMSRLAAYMREFALLLGSEERVHFKRVRKGSACLVALPDEEATPKVNSRLDDVIERTAPREALRAEREIDDLLFTDNATGHIARDGARVIEFPGRLRPPGLHDMGPVSVYTTCGGADRFR